MSTDRPESSRDDGPSSPRPDAEAAAPVFTGRAREKRTKRSVRFADVASQFLITVGGIGTIVAVGTVCVFLAAVVMPLFRGADAEPVLETAAGAGDVVHVAADEYLTIGLTIAADGTLTTIRLDDGSVLGQRRLFPEDDPRPTAWSFDPDARLAAVGFEDGSLRVLSLDFRTSFPSEDTVEERYFSLESGAFDAWRGGTLERTPEGQFRWQRLEAEVVAERAADDEDRGAIVELDHAGGEDGLVLLVRDETGLRSVRALASESMMTGDVTWRFLAPSDVPVHDRDGAIVAARIDGAGGQAYVGWADGTLDRYRLRTVEGPLLVESVDAVDDPAAELTVMEFLLGGATLVTGDSRGGLRGWFPAPITDDERADADAATAADRHVEGFVLIGAKTMSTTTDAAVRTLVRSTRTRMITAGFADGTIESHYLVSADRLLAIASPDGTPIERLSMTPKQDALFAFAGGALHRWSFDPRYPEASFATIFTPIWYEGYPEPDFSWQSSAATDTFEPKLSLVPLIFGTLKATFYSMIFGAPIALLAAIYTSEFLRPKARAIVKPTIELMASLPSVILGFLAALVFAPFVERVVPSVIAGFFLLPLVLLAGAYLWQLLPRDAAIRLERYRLLFILALLPIGAALAGAAGPLVERLLFGNDLRLWLNGLRAGRPDAYGGALGGWIVVLLPISALATGWVSARVVSPMLRRRLHGGDRRTAALADLVKFAGGALVTVAAATGLGLVLAALGFDVRAPLPNLGSFADTYDQRNALIVGFVMGFAIIPIIYTIADDALSTVPDHLRSASLGAGATPWQTAVRIVIPTAMSGLFSALMIGLGRAVGETMIVLMALGNTPVMNMNVFEGARTLSANIAVELPEAAIGSAHYRVLFLAALVLFVMTFVVNTVAEVVRLRFRKRAYQL